MEDISLIVPHQANFRIIEAAARGLKLPLEKFVINLERYGNTSTASIPIALCEAIEAGRVQRDDKLVIVGFGGGLTWGRRRFIGLAHSPARKRYLSNSTNCWRVPVRWPDAPLRRVEGWIYGRK